MKGFLQPEIYILLLKGSKPTDLIKIGLKRSTVYNYNARLPEIQIRLKEYQKRLKELKV